jgi:hypothetical protein
MSRNSRARRPNTLWRKAEYFAEKQSSSGPTRGDIAQGWTLNPVAVVRRDVQRETTPGVHMYTAHFGGAIRELVPVNGDPADAAVPGQTIQTYRARIDDDFTRFEMIAAGGTANWIVHTINGLTFYFGDNSQPGAPSAFGEEYYLSHVVDVWGNTASYQYTKLQWQMTPPQQDAELVLSAIEYTSNAGLTPHARIELNWPARRMEPGVTTFLGARERARLSLSRNSRPMCDRESPSDSALRTRTSK